MRSDESRLWQLLIKGHDGAILWDARAPLTWRQIATVSGRSTESSDTVVLSRDQAAALFADVPRDIAGSSFVLERLSFPKDPAHPPSPAFEWRGPEPVGGVWGVWFHPRTGETLRPHFSKAVFTVKATRQRSDADVGYYDVGINWVGESLRAGTELSHAVLHALNPKAPRVLTSLRSGAAETFSAHLSESADAHSPAIQPTAHILELLNDVDARCLLVENSVLQTDDALAASWRRNEVLGQLVVAIADLPAQVNDIAELIENTPSGYPTNAFATGLPTGVARELLSAGDVEAIARSIVAVAVRAFDCEGFVVATGLG